MTRDEYLLNIEQEFQNPLRTFTFEDEQPLEHLKFTVVFERMAGTMTQRELFVLKSLMFTHMGELQDISPGSLDARLLIAALYGDGKGKFTFKFRQHLSHDGGATLRQFYFSDIKPMSVNEAFQETVNSAQMVLEMLPDSVYAKWVKAQLLGKSPPSAMKSGLNDSKIYSLNAEAFGLPLGRTSQGGVVCYIGNRALVTIAPPESGKSLAQAIPALHNFAGHVFVLDIKGHFFERTAKLRHQKFHSRIINFNPLHDKAAHYNPLAFVSDDPDESWGEAAVLSELIVPVQNNKDSTWETMAQRLLALFVAYTVLTEKPEDRSMNKVLDLVSGIGTAEAMTLISSEGSFFPSAMRRAARTVLAVLDPKSHAQFTGILQALEQNLSIWNDPRVERASDRCDWSPLDFRGSVPVSVYLTIPLESISTYAPLIRVMTAQHIFQLMRKIPPADAKPILFLLDEFPQLGKMDPVKKAIEIGREYGIKTWLFAQFANQFDAAYGQAAKGLIDICGVRMFMNPTFAEAEAISKQFGNRTSMLSEKKEANMPVDEIIGPDHRNSVFVLSTNETPLVLSKNFLS